MDGMRNIFDSFQRKICVEGPVPVTEKSYPFCSMKHCRHPYVLSESGYVEEEYFIAGTANSYDLNGDRQAVIKKSGLSYKTRVIVRRPICADRFSGRVYVDILNATNCYDHEDLWTRIYEWCVENGHAYIGITSKPINVWSLKIFDNKRYETLCWSNGETGISASGPVYASIPGTEEGLIWDMLGQLAKHLRLPECRLLNGLHLKALYLTGQSQSGAYLNTFVRYFEKYLRDDNGKYLYDGYMNIVGAELERDICQPEKPQPLGFCRLDKLEPAVPYICLSSEGDISLFQSFMNEQDGVMQESGKYRCYELAGSPHFDIQCPVIPCDDDIRKSGQNPHVLPEEGELRLNDLPLAYYVNGLLDVLHRWAIAGMEPVPSKRFLRYNNGELRRDDFGNVLGGLRSPYVDVPIAEYRGFDEKHGMGICGWMKFFTKSQFEALYSNVDGYLTEYVQYISRQKEEGWIAGEDIKRMEQWARDRAEEFYCDHKKRG